LVRPILSFFVNKIEQPKLSMDLKMWITLIVSCNLHVIHKAPRFLSVNWDPILP